jgi:hypothetical protein
MMNVRSFFYLLIVFLLLSCHMTKTSTEEVVAPVQWGHLKSAYLTLPVSVSLAKVEKRVNESIPWQFKNAAWPGFDQRGCGEPQIKYTVTRDSIHLKPEGNTLYFDMYLSYGIEGNYCPLCFDGQCKSPALPFSCGVQNENARRMHWVGKIIWSIGADFRLKTRSETLKLKALDPCEFTFLKMDFTKLVQQEFEKAIASALQSSDQQMNKLNILRPYQSTLQALNKGIQLKGSEYLQINPQTITMSPVALKDKRLVTLVGLETQLTWSNAPAKGEVPLPIFQYVKDQKQVPWELDFSLTWEAIQHIVQTQWEGQSIALNGQDEFVLLQEIKVSKHEPGWMKVEGVADIQSNKAKRKNVRFELKAKPILDNQGQYLILEEMDFDLGFKNKIIEAGIGWELMQRKWKDDRYNQIALQSILSNVVSEVNQKAATIQTEKLGLKGAFQHATVRKLNLDQDGLKMTLALSGQWELLINP